MDAFYFAFDLVFGILGEIGKMIFGLGKSSSSKEDEKWEQMMEQGDREKKWCLICVICEFMKRLSFKIKGNVFLFNIFLTLINLTIFNF